MVRKSASTPQREERDVETTGHLRWFRVRDECREELLATLAEFVEASRREPGTLLYLVHVERDRPDLVWTYERYRDQAAYFAHADSPRHRAFKERVVALVHETEAIRLDLVEGKGMPSTGETARPREATKKN